MMDPKQLVQKLWNYCYILRDDGLSCGDYVEQLTYLLFLKMDDGRTKPPFNKPSDIPKEYNCESLKSKDGAELETHYIKTLNELRITTYAVKRSSDEVRIWMESRMRAFGEIAQISL